MAGIDLSPDDLGFPSKFSSWRGNQSDAIARILDSESRFVGLSMPTGDGKSGVYVAAAQVTGGRTVVLTSTKGLQSQLLSDFGGLGMVDIRGRANYQCQIAPDVNCEVGRFCHCSATNDRSAAESKCPYRRAYNQALASNLVVTNYSYWALIHKYGEGLGPVDMLVCDEAHDAPDEVCSVMTVTISVQDVERRLRADWPTEPDSTDCWKQWAKGMRGRVQTLLDDAQREVLTFGHTSRLVREVGHLTNLQRSLSVISEIEGEWVAELNRNNGYTLAPVWPHQYAEDVLFLGVPKIVLVSATILPKTCHLLGIEDEDLEFYDYPSSFPPRRSPVYYIPTVRVNHKWTSEDAALWLDHIDRIIGSRLDRRGIIHSVSYDRRDLILNRSKYARYMITHSPGSEAAMEQVRRFRNTPPPVILLSPSVTTGYDFRYTDCEYQIICKVPFPDTRSKIVQSRCGRLAAKGSAERERGQEYEIYSTVQTLVQESGRGMRAADDQCETFVTDDQINWIERAYKHLIPLWWRRLFRRPSRGTFPVPPPPLAASSTTHKGEV